MVGVRPTPTEPAVALVRSRMEESPQDAPTLPEHSLPQDMRAESMANYQTVVRPRQEPPPRRRVLLPLGLFAMTCYSTYSAGGQIYHPVRFDPAAGQVYMFAVMAILLTHEMGHFLQAVRHHVPASLPFFIPLPSIFITGTMGAVIVQGSNSNRLQLFDIGISGPLAGLLVAIPVTCIGIMNAEIAPDLPMGAGVMHFGDPLLVKLLIWWLRDVPFGTELTLNPLLMAGWFGLLLTGLNMMPVSQLDGGHVAYALLGRHAHTLAHLLILAVIAAMVITAQYQFVIMVILVLLIGVDHPPTSDDSVELGLGRKIIGFASLLIPIFCLSPVPLTIN